MNPVQTALAAIDDAVDRTVYLAVLKQMECALESTPGGGPLHPVRGWAALRKLDLMPYPGGDCFEWWVPGVNSATVNAARGAIPDRMWFDQLKSPKPYRDEDEIRSHDYPTRSEACCDAVRAFIGLPSREQDKILARAPTEPRSESTRVIDLSKDLRALDERNVDRDVYRQTLRTIVARLRTSFPVESLGWEALAHLDLMPYIRLDGKSAEWWTPMTVCTTVHRDRNFLPFVSWFLMLNPPCAPTYADEPRLYGSVSDACLDAVRAFGLLTSEERRYITAGARQVPKWVPTDPGPKPEPTTELYSHDIHHLSAACAKVTEFLHGLTEPTSRLHYDRETRGALRTVCRALLSNDPPALAVPPLTALAHHLPVRQATDEDLSKYVERDVAGWTVAPLIAFITDPVLRDVVRARRARSQLSKQITETKTEPKVELAPVAPPKSSVKRLVVPVYVNYLLGVYDCLVVSDGRSISRIWFNSAGVEFAVGSEVLLFEVKTQIVFVAVVKSKNTLTVIRRATDEDIDTTRL
jgi:hypothetical protein